MSHPVVLLPFLPQYSCERVSFVVCHEAPPVPFSAAAAELCVDVSWWYQCASSSCSVTNSSMRQRSCCFPRWSFSTLLTSKIFLFGLFLSDVCTCTRRRLRRTSSCQKSSAAALDLGFADQLSSLDSGADEHDCHRPSTSCLDLRKVCHSPTK